MRRAVRSDAAGIANLHAGSWRRTYVGIMPSEFLAGPVDADRAGLWTVRLSEARNRWHVTVAVDDSSAGELEQLAGFVALAPDEAGDGVLLDNLHVAPDQQGKGVGGQLLHAALNTSAQLWPRRDLYLWVLTANTGAARFYERHGGVGDGTRTETFPVGFRLEETRYVWRKPRAP